MEIASIVASFVSLIISVLAGWLAIYFYNKTKEDASRVEIALAEIREQTNALQSISSGFLDRLTKYVTTTPRNQPDPSRLVIDTLREIPEVVQMLRITSVSAPQGIDPRDWTLMLVALQNYAAETNFWASLSLPPAEIFDQNNNFHVLVKHILDRSMSDFRHVSGLLQNLDMSCVRGTNLEQMQHDTINTLSALIGDTAFHVMRRAQAAANSANQQG